MDGSVKCTKKGCLLVAKDPGTAQPASTTTKSHTGQAKSGTRSTAPKTEVQTAWSRHIETICSNAAASGALPEECKPKPAAKPAAAPPTAVPADATRLAMSKLVLPEPEIGSAPCRGCGTFVGLPLWLWTQPWTPQTASATAGPFTVTATARPTQIVWDLGDGSPAFVCNDAGVPYQESFGFEEPYCGSRYEAMGDYNLTGTWTWEVSWTGAATGSTTMTTTSSMPINVAESQVIITSNS